MDIDGLLGESGWEDYLSIFHVPLYSLYDTRPGTLTDSTRILFAYLVAKESGEQQICSIRGIVDTATIAGKGGGC